MDKIKVKERMVVTQNYKNLAKDTIVEVLKINDDNTVDIVIASTPELWLKNIPVEILANS